MEKESRWQERKCKGRTQLAGAVISIDAEFVARQGRLGVLQVEKLSHKQAGWLAGWLAGRHARSQHGKGDSTTYDQRRTGWWDWVKKREGESRKKGRLDLVREGCARLNNETATKFDP